MLGISIKRQLARTVLCGAVAAMCLTAPAAAPAALSPGPEIQVNANTGFHQEPVIAPGPNGGFTVVWRGTDSAYDPDCISLNQSCPGSQEIYARRFDAAGAPLGGEITVNATTTGNQSAPAVASDPGGGFTVVWAGNGPGDGTGIYARRFDAAGAPLGGEMAVNATTVGDQAMPAVASDPGGGFTAVWQSHSEVGGQDYYDVYARRFDAAGAALGGEIAVNTVANGAVFEAYGGASPAIAADAGGGFTVAWHSHTPDSSGWDVYARRFDAGGAPLGGEIAVGTTPGGLLSQPSPAIAPRPGGGFTVTWIEIEFSSSGGCWGWFDYGCTPEITWTFSSAVYARGFDAGGAALGNEFQVTAAAGFSQPAIAPDPGGGYTVVWDSVYVQRFDASGTPLLFDGNTLVAAEESPSRPAVAPDGSGGFTVTWQSTGQPGGSGIYARHFSDIDAPDTRIDSGPGLTNDPTPTFTFAASEQGSSFECRVDSDPFAACSGPGGSHTSTTTLTDGPHSFEVRATDGADRIDPWPARRSFTVDTVPPDTSVYDNPFRIGDPIDFLFTSPIPVFYLSSSESGSGYGCRIYAQGETQPPFSGCGYSTCSYFCVGPYYTPGSPLPDGNYTFEARATDPASNMDPTPAIVNFTVDTTPLNAHIDSGPEGPSSDTTATFSFYSSGNDLDHFSCRLSGPGDSLWTDNPCNSPRTYTTLADGDYTFVVRAEDLAGNLGPTASRSFTVDTVADTQIDSGPEGPTNEPTPSFAFSSEAGASFECSLDGSGFSACASPYTTTPLADGSHTFEVRATDALGNTDPSPASRSFTVDTEAPAEPSFNATDPASPANDNTPLIRGSAVEGTVRIYASGDCSGAVAGEGSAAGFAGPGIEVSVADDSTTSFHATVTDAAGNPSACSVDSLSYTEDSTAPVTAIDSGPAGPGSNTTANFTFSSPDGDLDHFSCSLSGPGGVVDHDPCDSPRTYTALADGDYTFEARAEDLAGNLGPPASRSFTIDTVADTQIDSGPDGPTNDPTPSFAFSSEAGASFECSLDGGAFSPCSSPHTTPSLADGPHTFEVRATDALGNTDPSPASRSFTVDTVAPSEPAFTATVPASPASDNMPLIRGSASEGTVRIYASGDCSGSVAGQGSAASFADPGIEVSVPDDSTTSFHATTTDAAGNTSACSADSISYAEDSTAPDTMIDSGPVGPTNDSTPSFGFSSEAGATFECQLDGGGYSVCSSPLTTSSLSDGSHTFEVRATDALGNTDPSPASRSFTVDTVAPETEIDSGPADGTTISISSPDFGFSSPHGDLDHFSCSLSGPGGTLEDDPCESPRNYTDLADGSYTFSVRARDLAGNVGAAAVRNFTVDSAPPASSPSPPPDTTTGLPASAPVPDTFSPNARLFAKKWQVAGEPITVGVTCSEQCVIAAAGEVLVWGHTRGRAAARATRRRNARFGLRKATGQLNAGQSAILKLRPRSRKAGRRLRLLVRSGRKARARIRVSYWGQAGSMRTAKMTVRLWRGRG